VEAISVGKQRLALRRLKDEEVRMVREGRGGKAVGGDQTSAKADDATRPESLGM
jgi:hypothetical protein